MSPTVLKCQWWLLCQNEATGTQPHPILGDVPICDRCRKRVEDLTQKEQA